ncbi:MAG TPA: dimethylargininase, partial [Xanthomonadaceae bacterium]|nr:dimethylargininase [Xanthomonadaceae bacterium]
MRIAITRRISPTLADCQLSFVPRVPLDVERAEAQHRDYCRALAAAGCSVVELAPEPDMPDAVFVEDTAVVVEELAVVTRPGAPSRRGEGATVRPVLARFRPLAEIEAPGTLDGGDVLRIGRRVFVGESARSNADGIARLRALLQPHGYTVQGVTTRDCLHLKSAVTALGGGTLLVQPEWVDPAVFADYRVVPVDPGEEHAANALRIGEGTVVYPDCFPRTQARIEAAGVRVLAVDVSELQKAEGA